MHTAIVIFGVIANIILALAVVAIIVGLVWIISPLRDRIYIDVRYLYYESTPMGGRETGLVILGFGFACLASGLLMDEGHSRLIRKYGART